MAVILNEYIMVMVVVSMQEYMKDYWTVLLALRDRKRAWLVLKRSGEN